MGKGTKEKPRDKSSKGKEDDGEVENVKVAVRTRPFNKREKARNAKVIIAMNGPTTTITDPSSGEEKKFTFDYSYWSFDGYKEEKNGYCAPDSKHPNGKKFCDQKKVFDDVGRGILENAWNGFHTSLFAYGQTGSGKSWSVIGYGPNKGIVPMFTEELFNGIKAKGGSGTVYEVKFSMLEIYNEVVRDLLDPKGGQKKGGLKVRQHPKKGFYADGLKQVMVSSFEEIQTRMDEGTVNRTVASTNMNATSSRAHTIVGIHFIQKKKNSAGKETAKNAIVNLVDLAGSERVESTGATGDRLKEGAAINQSLSCLGNVIHALAEQSEGKKTRVPYRDSALTKLLQNALGGNSKTIMIAAISPADINYDESLSTLRYADRAKQIKTKATVNEDPVEQMIRELKEENEKLRAKLKGGKLDKEDMVAMGASEGMSDEEIEKMKKEWLEEMKSNMDDNDKEMEEMRLSYEEKLKAAQAAAAAAAAAGGSNAKQAEKEKTQHPHIYNLNFDPQLSGKIVHILKKPETEIGNNKPPHSDITMVGPGIHNQHCILKLDGKKVKVKPCERDCRVLVNGAAITGETDLDHNDRLVIGSTHTWVFGNPHEPGIERKKYPPITYEYAQEEIASKAGINIDHAGSSDVALLQEDLIDVMPAVEEANSISEELDKRVKFEIILISPQMLGKMQNKVEVCVKMKNLENGTEFIWTKEKFLNRLYLMKEMYSNYEEEEDDWDLPEEKDPFAEDLNQAVKIGDVRVFLQPIAYMVEMKEQLEIIDLKGNKIGVMNLEVAPCDSKGREYTEKDDMFVDSPDELVGKEVNFSFKIINCRGLPNKYTDVHCRYRIYLDEQDTESDKISLTANPDFNHKKLFKFKPATRQLVDYLNNGSVLVEIHGKQYIRKSAVASKKGLTTKDMLKADRGVFSKTAVANGFPRNGVVDPQKQSVIVELLLMKKTQARLQQKSDNVKKMLERADQLQRGRISTHVVKAIFAANSDEQFAAAMKQLEADTDGDDGDYGGRPESGDAQSGVCVIL